MATLIDSYSESNWTGSAQPDSNYPKYGQVFKADGRDLLSCKFYLNTSGSPTGNMYVRVYAITGTPGTDAEPTGSALAVSDAVDASTLTLTKTLIEFLFTGANRIFLEKDVWYALVFEPDSVSVVINIGIDQTSPTHDGNPCRYYDVGGNWIGYSGIDFIFYVYGTEIKSIDVNDSITITTELTLSIYPQRIISITDIFSISENITTRIINSGIQAFIVNTNVSKYIERSNFMIENILTNQVDRCKFTVRKYGSFTTEPETGQEVLVYNNGTKIFGGIIVKVTQRADDFKVIKFEVECEDYTRLLDRKLVVQIYQNQTIAQIIESIVSLYLAGSGFTTNNVTSTTNVTSITFNYIPISECLKKLANMVNYDWYVDYNKDIHFFASDTETAPFNLADDDGSYVFSSLRIRRDNSQIRNRVYIRGGDYLSDTFTTEFISNGIQNVYPLPYKYSELAVTVTGELYDQGIDGIDPITTKDYIWNNNEKFIRFRGDKIPSDTSDIKIYGPPFLPVRVVVQDNNSIDDLSNAEGDDGIAEFVITDETIITRGQARERANAELDAYKSTLSEGSFITYEDGLKAGQTITINSTAHGINEEFMINKVIARMHTHNALEYDVSLITTKTFGIIELLQNLLTKDTRNITIDENEIIDTVFSEDESVVLSESVTERALNYQTEFVAGSLFVPSGVKRQFITGGSPLGPRNYINQENDINIKDVVTIAVS